MNDIHQTVRERIHRHAFIRARTQNEESDGKTDQLFIENQVQIYMNYIYNISEDTIDNLFQNCRGAAERQAAIERIDHIKTLFAREIAALRVYRRALENHYSERQARFLAEEILG